MASKQDEGNADHAGKAIATKYQICFLFDIGFLFWLVFFCFAECGASVSDEGEARNRAAKRSSAEVLATSTCRRSDGKGWHCRHAAVDGRPYCEHHLSLLRARTAVSSSSVKIKKPKKEHKVKEKAAAAETWNSSGAECGENNGGDGNENGGVH